MFLDVLRRRNPALLAAAGALALERQIPPNTFVIDLDTVRANGAAIRGVAAAEGLQLYFMTKQFGRNPLATAALVENSKAETVAVDMADANALVANGFRLGHVGNLVQVPDIDIPRVVAEAPEVITVFSVEKAAQISKAAMSLGRTQAILLRVSDLERDIYLPGMEGGFPLPELVRSAETIRRLPGIAVAGVTTFPALSYAEAGHPVLAPNFETLLRAREMLERMGIEVTQVNAPGNTSTVTLAVQAQSGATHVEPGHGVLGTTPFHLLDQTLPERPAACYVTEVAHHVGDTAYIYGGGFFVDDPVWLDPQFQRRAMVGRSLDELFAHDELFLGAGSGGSSGFGGIDYYGFLAAPATRAPVGATVLMGFRMQSFVTRAHIAVVSGVGKTPVLEGLFDQHGQRNLMYG